MRIVAILLACLFAGSAHAASADTWMAVMLGGRKIGSMQTTRDVRGERVVTTQNMHIELERSGTRVDLSTTETDEETADGRPLAFESRTRMSGVETRVTGTIDADGNVKVRSNVGGSERARTMAWPRGALLAEGLRLAEQRAGNGDGTRYTSLAFQPDSLQVIQIDSQVGPTVDVELPEGTRRLTRVDQLIRLPDAPTRSVAWMDAEQNVAKLVMPVMGYELTMLACSQVCAQGPNQSADILLHALAASPRAVGAAERGRGLRLTVGVDGDGEPLRIADTDEQRVASGAADTRVVVEIRGDRDGPGVEAPPTDADRGANDWLQSNAKEIVDLARRGAGDAATPAAQMQKLEDFVRAYIDDKDLSVGYASALEVARKPQGDCTEHAVLLAALGRARGIPTRVVDGIVYVDRYAGREHVFVPHAWTQAWIDGRWRSYDAALHGFDAGHLALSVGDGDPWRFFAGFNALGRLRIESVEALP
jgi:hypothetical protein